MGMVRQITCGVRGGLITAALALAALSTGCETMGNNLLLHKPHHCERPAASMFCTWQNAVQFSSDPTQGGKPVWGVAGRMYLLDEKNDGKTLVEGGTMSYTLFDDCGPEPVKKEIWNFDEETTARLVRKDMFGQGYTIFLPTRDQLPTKIVIRASFSPADGRSPLYTENRVTLDQGNGAINMQATPLPNRMLTPTAPPGGGLMPHRIVPGANNAPTLPPPTKTVPGMVPGL